MWIAFWVMVGICYLFIWSLCKVASNADKAIEKAWNVSHEQTLSD